MTRERDTPGVPGLAGRLRDLVTVLLVVGGLAVAAAGAWQWHASDRGDADRLATSATGGDQGSRGAAPLPRALPAPSRPGAPLRVVVPALRIDAPVDPVAAPGGTLTPPADPTRLGWWAGGARPGDRGSVLVAGHTVNGGGGALDDLERLRRGDRVVVRTRTGTTGYAVVGVQVLDKGELARRAQQLFDQAVPGRLVLVTCEGWDGRAYRSNVVVTARPRG